MNKRILVETIEKQLESDLLGMKEAARASHDAATNEESVPENEYDTRALEASYLAGAQAKRAAEIERQLLAVRAIKIKNFSKDDAAEVTAIVQVEHDGKTQHLFLMPGGGGMALSQDGKTIQVVTPHSPLGESLLGTRTGDIAILERGSKVQEYEIINIA